MEIEAITFFCSDKFPLFSSSSLSALSERLNNVPIVDTTISLPAVPVRDASDNFQSNPRGLKIGDIKTPVLPAYESSSEEGSLPGASGNVKRNHIIIDIARIIVPAFLRYCQVLSHMCMSILLSEGILYGGSSITKGSASPLNLVTLRSFAVTMAKIIPIKYIENIIFPALSGKKVPANNI